MAWTLDTLVRSPWLARQPAPVAQALLAAGRVYRVEAGQLVYGLADFEAGLCAVVSGRLAVEGDAGGERSVLIDIVRGGAWLGQSAPEDGRPRPVIIRARSQCDLFLISDAALRKVGRTRADVWRSVADLVDQQLQTAVRMIARLLTASPAELIALRLVTLAEGSPPSVIASQSDLGELTGLTRKAVNAHLSQMESAGLVTRAYGRVVLSDVAGLRRLAGG